MKKLLSIAIAAMLVLSCTISAFAVQTPVGASADEADKTVTSIEFKTLPTKTDYNFSESNDGTGEAGVDLTDIIYHTSDDDADLDAYVKAHFFINVDLTGAVIEATYSDGTKSNADLSLCTTSVADPPSIFDVNIERQYTINVDYKGATTSFKVNLLYDMEYDSDFEVVSFTMPKKTVYTMEDTYTDDYYDEETGEFINDIYFDIDTTGMSAVVRNKITGEMFDVTEEDIFCDTVTVDRDEPYGEYGVFATACFIVDTDEGDEENLYDFADFSFNVTFENTDATQPTVEPTTEGGKASSTSDTAKADTTKGNTNDNGTVQTGNEMTAVVLAILMISGVAFAFFCTRKRLEK